MVSPSPFLGVRRLRGMAGAGSVAAVLGGRPRRRVVRVKGFSVSSMTMVAALADFGSLVIAGAVSSAGRGGVASEMGSCGTMSVCCGWVLSCVP